ncbi:hypothetical protein PR202_ga17891 [Eleusine coracana subsp. coracana]|uniref:Homeodomain-like superfamily protein n=1 Tax=Eleusine coracana subsp. coracana TaxID=191504 RepID=A0AAV5CRJ3_ELECO|nr:hypothetical protein PR202_ga17891 [Eleusine coracana subsp. coracana]
MDADDDVEEDDMDFNPFLREGSPSETSSSLTSEAEAECEEHCSDNQPSRETYQQNSPGNENASDSALPQNSLLSKPISNDVFVDKSSTQVNCDKNDGSLNVLEKEVLPNEAVCSPTMQNSDHLLLKESEEDAICRRTRARYSLENYSLEELETFLQESDDDGDLQNVDEEEEYRKFLAAVLSGGSDDTVACHGDENQDEDENDADFELEIEEALESDGDENAENDEDTIGRKEKDGRRPQTRQRRPFTQLSGPGSHRHESTKTHLKHILPYVPPALLNLEHAFGWQYPSQNALYPSSLISATCTPLVNGFTDQQLGQLHVLIHEHVQLLIQSFSLCVLDPSKQDVASNVKKMIVELVGCRDQALATSTPFRQFFFDSHHLHSSSSVVSSESSGYKWAPLVKSPIISILDVSPLQLALGLLAFGLLEYNNDWGAIQKRFLPCKSTHQIFVRQKNRSSSKAPDNPIKEVRRMKTSPLTVEEKESIREGLKMFKNDWTSVWRFVVPHRDPSLLQRQWRAASGLQKSYNKSEAAKEKRRSYEAKRRKLKASMPNSRVVHEQEVDNNSSDGIENDDDSYVNEAFLEDTDRSLNILPSQLSLPGNAGKSMVMQSGTGHDEECGATGSYFEQRKGSSKQLDVSTSYIPFVSCTSDGPSSVRALSTTPPRVSRGSLDQLQASRFCNEKGSCVVKLAPDLPPVNLPPSVRVISQVAFRPNATHCNGSLNNAAKDIYRVPPLPITESSYRQLNLFPDHSASSRLQQNGISNENNTEDGTEQDFQMHPLLFQYPRDVLSSCSHPVQNLINHSRKYDIYPFEKVHVERTNNQTTGSTSTGNRSTVNANTIDFHPLLQRTEIEMHEDVREDDYLHSVNQSECNTREAQVDDQSIAVQASRSPCQRESNIDLNINLCSPMELKNANDFRDTVSKSNVQDIGCRKDKASVSELEVVKACSHHCIEEPNEESMQGIVMEQEELSDSEEDSQHVEFECEEMDDSEEEQVQGMEASLIQNKSTSASVVCGDFHGCNVQSQIQQELDQVGKQGASLVQKLQGSSRSARGKLKPETVKRTGSRANQRLPTSRTGEPSRTKSRSSKMQQDQSSAVRRSSDSRRTRKNPARS